MNIHEVIRAPLVTEKSEIAREENNAYTFEVDRRASKDEIRAALKQFFGVDAIDIRTSIVRGKVKRVGRTTGRTSSWKKAVVVLPKDQTLELFNLSA